MTNPERESKLGKDISYCIDANYHKGTNTTLKSRRQLVMEEHTIAYSKSTRKTHIDARGKIDCEANTLSCGDGCVNQSTGNFVFIKEEDMADIKLIAGQTAPNQPRKSLYRQQGRVYSTDGISPTTTESDKNAHIVDKADSNIRIRKLTPLEAERLMYWPDNWTKYGVDENGKQYELSNSARYKACGNGIVSSIPKHLLDLVTGNKQGLRVFSTFAGVDGSGLLLKEPKYVKVGFSEFEPKMKAQHAANVLRYHYPDVPNLGDITKIDVKDVPDHDIIFISAPCQDFSSAGNNLGIEGTRGTLFYETARIMQVKRPRWFIFENVKNLLSKKHGGTFEIMCEVYSSLGYELDFEVINAKYYGVAQNRERVFLVGRLK